ncbi:MAG: glycosyltransferase family 25 protein [Holosporaceae bacterium]|jgi:GR25 family glycosyltransferase involved in LPS biosynthesis|nr:glycosyltransferase family 25 protein [Holosporaceae bacterium]
MRRLFIFLFLLLSFRSSSEVPTLEGCDAIYVINLDRTPKRFDFMKEQFQKDGIKNYVRFSAVDGYGVQLVDKFTGEIIVGKEAMSAVREYTWAKRQVLYRVDYGEKYKDAAFDLFVKYRKFSAGEIGVTFSHRAIWREVVKNNCKNVIIFEDDVTLLKDFRKDVVELIRHIPADADITFIGVGRRRDKAVFFPNIDNIFRDLDHVEGNDWVAKIEPTNLVYGMYAYIISAEGAKKLLKLTDRCEFPLDDIIFQQGGVNTGIIKAYVSKKKMCYPTLENSEIKKMGRPF